MSDAGPRSRCSEAMDLDADLSRRRRPGAARGLARRWRAGESVAITGPSGCGKSTLLHLLGGLDRPTAGDGRVRGDAARHARPRRLPGPPDRLRLPVVPPAADAHGARERAGPDVRGRLAPRRAGRRGPSGCSTRSACRTAAASSRTGSPSASASAWRSPGPWPTSPTLLLADEPTGNLDSVSQDEVLELLDRLRRERSLTLVIVTHSPEVAAAGDRVIKMRDGRIVDH